MDPAQLGDLVSVRLEESARFEFLPRTHFSNISSLVAHLNKKFPAFYATRRFINFFHKSPVFLEKLVVALLPKKFSAIYGNRRFITMFSRTRFI